MATPNTTKTPMELVDAVENLELKISLLKTLHSLEAEVESEDDRESVNYIQGSYIRECHADATAALNDLMDYLRATGALNTPPEVLAQLENLGNA
ncbi:hypothetical protein E2F43_10750 [Seongchinamella unica]|uniref:Uncharacterized protein n=1 Tax=Seongchinamella unica TaxID=2547392 RepID=A0A4R5LSQ9_9GAMM|nr:hypothetical protein [Seongchinamella unica]TDG13965.1 hypothetical protein E2F43_10750 [Seongchinamella unica]